MERVPVIRLRNVGVSYDRRAGFFRRERFWALQDVSFDVFQGETLGIIGRNGVGKTTLLQVLAGIIRPDRGQIEGVGCRASILSLQLGFLNHLTGKENVILSGMLMGLSRQEILSRMDAILEFSELEDFIEQPMNTYSSGMRARLGFAVAFQADPDILLIDEVLGVGDAEFRQKSTAAMQEKIRSDKTVILVSHSAPTIRLLCDRAIWVDKGRSMAEGGADEVLNEYLGSLNQPAPPQTPKTAVTVPPPSVARTPTTSDQREHPDPSATR